MDRTIDHAAFGGTELYEPRTAVNEIGLMPTYGDKHGTGTTYMVVVPLPNGSYLKFIASTLGTDAMDAGFWPDYLAAGVSPTAWCLETDDATSVETAIDAGLSVGGPHEASRARPDGRLTEWDMCFEGSDQQLPFFIHDRTPRGYRVPEAAPSASFRGLQTVAVATRGREATAALFTRRHRYPSPIDISGPSPELVMLPGMPSALCEPGDGVLDMRIDGVSEESCAFLVGVTDPDRACTALSPGPGI